MREQIKIEIKNAKKEDINKFVELYQLAYSSDVLREYAYSKRSDIRDYYKWLIKRDASGIFKAELKDRGEIVGFICADANWISYLANEQCGAIHELFVKPEFQKKGIGKKLVLHALDYFKNKNIKKAELWVGLKNERAKKFYSCLGFRESIAYGKWLRMVKDL